MPLTWTRQRPTKARPTNFASSRVTKASVLPLKEYGTFRGGRCSEFRGGAVRHFGCVRLRFLLQSRLVTTGP